MIDCKYMHEDQRSRHHQASHPSAVSRQVAAARRAKREGRSAA